MASTPNETHLSLYDSSHVILHDSVASNLQITRSVLYTMGFRNFEQSQNLLALKELLERSSFDLLLIDCTQDIEGVSNLIKKIRFGDVGLNPYLVIVATAWTLSNMLVRNVIDAGADDLIGRPYATDNMMKRLNSHIELRKRFVVTSDYVGPDRREASRSSQDGNLIDVPNSLRAKVKKEYTSETEAAAAIELTKAAITAEKMRRQAFQIGVISRLLGDTTSISKTSKQGKGSAVGIELGTLVMLTDDLDRRVMQTDFSHAGDLCSSLLDVAKSLSQAHSANEGFIKKDLALLTKLSTGLQIAFNPGSNESSITSDIAEVISGRNLSVAS